MSELQHAAWVALQRRYAEREAPGSRIERVSLDIEAGGTRELVSIALRGGALSWSCSCGQPECSHAHAALLMLAHPDSILATSSGTVLAAQSGGPATSRHPSSDRRTVAYAQPESAADPAALAEILRDLVTAVVRSGLASGVSASIEEVLQRLLAAAPTPLPLGVGRFIGRLKRAIGERDADEAARMLYAADQIASDLDSHPPSDSARIRLRSWLGSLADEVASAAGVTDMSLVEIAREWLGGVERAAVERRYMIDPNTGLFYREERAQGAQDASLGPCPRQLTELLALVEDTAPPRRVRLLQYAVTPLIDSATWEQLSQWALTDFGALAGNYRHNLSAFAGLGEPFAMVAPTALGGETSCSLSDAQGNRLPVLGPERAAVSRCLRDFADGSQLLWVAGRVLDRDGRLGLLPLSAAARRNGRISYAQM